MSDFYDLELNIRKLCSDAVFCSEKHKNMLCTYYDMLTEEEKRYFSDFSDQFWQFAKDGELYDLEGYKTLVLGGAYSVDKFYRLECGARWFADEQIAPERRKAILEQITTFGQLDLVLSHTCPYSWQPTDLFLNGLDQSTVDNSMEKWLEEVETRLNYRHWLFAHFHDDRKINSKVTMLFNTIRDINQIMEG